LAIDDGSGDDQVIIVRAKSIDISTLSHSVLSHFKGSLADWGEVIPTDVRKINFDKLRTGKYLCLIQRGKKKLQIAVYPTSYSNLRVFENRNGTSGGGGGSDSDSGNNSQAVALAGASNGAQVTTTEAVNITIPEKKSIVVRGKYGIYTKGSASIAKSVKLDWGNGGETVTVTVDGYEYWEVRNLPLASGDYTLKATVADDDSSTTFTVILKPAIVGYTAEEIQAVLNDRPGHPQQGPTKSGYIAADAGLLTQDKPLVDKGVHIDEVKALASNAKGDYNLFYSGSGYAAFIEKRVNFIFGKNLSEETKTILVNSLLKEKKPGFMDVTNAYHEAMNKTLELYFADKAFEQFVANMDSTKYGFDATSFIVAEIAKEVVHLKLNVHLMNSDNGAPLLMRQDAKRFVFIFVATSVVGSGFGGLALKIGSKASRATKSYLNKFQHKFARSKNTKPPQGLHNQEWDDVAMKSDSFKTVKPVDMDNLSKTDETAKEALLDQGKKDSQIKQLLSSGDDFTTKNLKSGDKLYGFDSSVNKYGAKNQKSMYWLDEAGYQDIKSRYYKNGVWNKEGVKNHLALPCMNRADVIDVSKVTESHNAVESTVGIAREQVAYTKDNYSTGMMGKIMPGGGKQITPDSTNIGPVARMKGTP